MLQKSTQWVTDRLVERALPSIGSFMASALQRMLILGHAEHHSQLEDQARRYEAAGKPYLAKLIRDEAEQLSLADPFGPAPAICEKLADNRESIAEFPIGIAGGEATNNGKKRKRKQSESDAALSDSESEQ